MYFENQRNAHDILAQYRENYGFIFFEQGIMISLESKEPLLIISSTLNLLSPTVHAAHLHENVLALNCHTSLNEEELASQGFGILPVKSYLAQADAVIQTQILKAYHWLNWDLNSQFCGRCSHPLSKSINSVEKKCERCHSSIFPKMSPAVMVLIYREKEILLARSHHFKPGMFSAVAGFVELGETAEMTAIREVKEELGVNISDLEYFGTQTWPFPDSFMIAFKAKYASGEVVIDHNEIEAAGWFNKETLPLLPPSASISRRLIESVIHSW